MHPLRWQNYCPTAVVPRQFGNILTSKWFSVAAVSVPTQSEAAYPGRGGIEAVCLVSRDSSTAGLVPWMC